MSRLVFSGATCCLTTSRPSGSSTSVSAGASFFSATPWLNSVCTLQLVGARKAWVSRPPRSTDGGGGGSPSTRVASKRIEKLHQKISKEALPLTRSGRGPSSSPSSETEKRLV